jgi:GNAT superfamily N-acetyltransferase
MQRAGEPDVGEIMAIFKARQMWLRTEKRSNQWEGVDGWRPLVRYLVRHGNVWVLVDDDAQEEIVGTVTLTTEPDFDFWTEAQQAVPALYLCKLATSPALGGLDLGGLMLDWAVDRAAELGYPVVRLDTWRTSKDLRKYYEKRGWDHVGNVIQEHRQSGTLFEKSARRERSAVIPTKEARRVPRRTLVPTG